MKAKFIYESLDQSEFGFTIFNDNDHIGYIGQRHNQIGEVKIDPHNSFTDEDIIEQGYDPNHIFKNSVLWSGGFQIKKEFRNQGFGRKAVKDYFEEHPEIDNIFLYAVPWQGAIEFWHKIGGKSILKIENDKKSIHFIQIKRDELNEAMTDVLRGKSEMMDDFKDTFEYWKQKFLEETLRILPTAVEKYLVDDFDTWEDYMAYYEDEWEENYYDLGFTPEEAAKDFHNWVTK